MQFDTRIEYHYFTIARDGFEQFLLSLQIDNTFSSLNLNVKKIGI
jgi:hypothetical protein